MRVASMAGVASVQVCKCASFKKINFPPQAVPLLFKEGKKTPSTYICRKMGKVSYFLVG